MLRETADVFALREKIGCLEKDMLLKTPTILREKKNPKRAKKQKVYP